MPRKRTKNLYFTQETEDKIFEYIQEKNESKRNVIYERYLYKPLRTISEVYHSKLSTDYIEETREDAINDCITYLTTNALKGVRKGKGKAFSYLSISARNFFIQTNNQQYRNLKKFKTDGKAEDLSNIYIDEDMETKEYNVEFLEKFYSFIEWFKTKLDDLELRDARRYQVESMLDYMENFEVDSYHKKDMLQEIYSRYGFRDDNYATAREIIKLNMLHYFKEWDKENYNPNIKYLRRQNIMYELSDIQKDYIHKHYQKCSHQHGVRAISKKLNIPETTLRTYVVKEGLH